MRHRKEIYKDGVLVNVFDDRRLAEEKEKKIAEIKSYANKLLSESDWKVVRATESGRNLDDDTSLSRRLTRSYSDEAENCVNSCEDLESLDRCQWSKHFK